jgi:hypothetical protein
MKVKMVPAKFGAEVKGTGDRIPKKKLEIETELSSKREIQMGDVALLTQHAQARQLLEGFLNECSGASGPDLAAQSRDPE